MNNIMVSDPTRWTLQEISLFARLLAVELVKDEPIQLVGIGGDPLEIVWLTEDGRVLTRLAKDSKVCSSALVAEVGQVSQQGERYIASINAMYGEGLASWHDCDDPVTALVEICKVFWLRFRAMIQQSSQAS